jgi:hypothetical protein
MGFRFRQAFRLGRFLRVNLSKGGASVSAGRPGATLNVGPGGPKASVGIPGTGLSHERRVGRGGCLGLLAAATGLAALLLAR